MPSIAIRIENLGKRYRLGRRQRYPGVVRPLLHWTTETIDADSMDPVGGSARPAVP